MQAKTKTVWFCSNCGNEYSKWMGKCPSCGQWNTMVEKETVTGKRPVAAAVPGGGSKPMPLADVSATGEERISLGSAEVDRLLGGGIVKGSLVLMGGEPGIGKSTLSLQLPLRRPELKTLYVTGEESVRQVKMRSDRLGGDASNCFIFSETDMNAILEQADAVKPDLMIVDSVQTMY
ncbi:MAG: DNA repair protein RadA, partial [Bacteroidales bacterium]|nr:DNA repair protein RadA [Bacteroidales bacterium]